MYQVEKIIQSPSEILIKWSDDTRQIIKASDLQARCPCVNCEMSKRSLELDIKIISIKIAGRLGLKITFSSGCQKGLFSFDLLRSWAKS